jgi:Flp pilus assembly pilin Flp
MSALHQSIRRLLADESGSSIVEEALILGVMVVVVMWGIVTLTNTLQSGVLGSARAIGDVVPAS